ncbi:hypothetical protein [Leeuwenhoekiella marinoflava]|uniref:GOLD domain-containing protein n=2 Tax=Leeuwenhoekiella marinoflava TaxID=988 RepID=A0A4Q0PK96_9FLAO|nr:hypothetical protein [Leeuwenhoekiella marinoflava]RXG28390.1 hypothetical protein DSL99_2391 [Leeuwenhoekiella marinoflava]SHF50661.1 hypothetical protein SAMN02745246_02682 [Leeuwenhoekiella marinoflava DSM 3653]
MKIKNLLFILSAFVVFSCDSVSKTTDHTDSEECTKIQSAYVSEVTGEQQVEAGSTLDLTVSFPVMSGCGQFNEFKETATGKTITVEVEAIYKGCICTMDIPTRTATYTFNPSKRGSYTLKFKSSDTDYIEKTIRVN